ncbi:MAG TPA: SET domain-containing protein-lysine N-methyltransferase [Candidatus Binatia bacterium]|nr:SET domain-containing protein-lysine N-methyltransferase [Candidatus Binatia bacterium]
MTTPSGAAGAGDGPDSGATVPAIGIRPSPIQGQGVFALRAIPAGTQIIEYTGEMITAEEADNRYDDTTMERHHTFLFSLDDGRCIDAGVNGNEARFINHSCDPNCAAIETDGHIWIEAMRPIAAGEELTYDYAYERSEIDEALAGLYVCRCGARACRGTILAPAADCADTAGHPSERPA